MSPRLWMSLLVIALMVMWWLLPKVTAKDARAYAEALFLEQCHQHNWNPHQYAPPKFSVEGGNRDLIFVYRYASQNLPSITVRIDKMGETKVVSGEAVSIK